MREVITSRGCQNKVSVESLASTNPRFIFARSAHFGLMFVARTGESEVKIVSLSSPGCYVTTKGKTVREALKLDMKVNGERWFLCDSFEIGVESYNMNRLEPEFASPSRRQIVEEQNYQEEMATAISLEDGFSNMPQGIYAYTKGGKLYTINMMSYRVYMTMELGSHTCAHATEHTNLVDACKAILSGGTKLYFFESIEELAEEWKRMK